jgi:hypothetical protein
MLRRALLLSGAALLAGPARAQHTCFDSFDHCNGSGPNPAGVKNLWSNSANAALWSPSKVGTPVIPVVTANNAVSPDGTTTATLVASPAVSGAGNGSYLQTSILGTASPYSFSVWFRGNAGGETLYICTTPDGVLYYRTAITLTTAWQRFSLTTPNLTTVGWFFILGTDLRDAGQVATPAQSFFAWGGQLETGTIPNAYVSSPPGHGGGI